MTLPEWDTEPVFSDVNSNTETSEFGFLDIDELEPEIPAENYDTPSGEILDANPRPRGAVGYEKKVNSILMMGVAVTAPNPATVADAATILIHGKKFSRAYGDLAATNDNVASVVDFLNGGVMNPVTAAVSASVPLILQLLRNHEPELQTVTRINIPFTRQRIGFTLPHKVKFKLGPRAKSLTNEPESLFDQAFMSEAALEAHILDKLGKRGINVARYVPRHRPD